MLLDVNVVCRNYREDRVIPRFSRYLSDFLGWQVSPRPVPGAQVYYLSGYFEIQMSKNPVPGALAAYFTHREIDPPGNAKSELFDAVAAKADLRIATAGMYARELMQFGDTVQVNPPVERHRFVIPARDKNQRLVIGFSGYTYSNQRKGENLAQKLVKAKLGSAVTWKASGRGWPVKTVRYPWAEMPAFYQSLDVLVITATVEGVPMPPLEALACGVSVVIPRGVGLLDELPDVVGIHRYKKGNYKSLKAALKAALELRSSVDRQVLRDVTIPYSIFTWCDQHRSAFEELVS